MSLILLIFLIIWALSTSMDKNKDKEIRKNAKNSAIKGLTILYRMFK